jgi:hypothetical protein
MVRLISILSTVVILGCLALATAADAQNQSPGLAPPPLQCTIASGTVTVRAVPDGSGFPVPAACPTNTLGVENCLRWSYEYKLNPNSGNNISLSAITADSDVDIVAATGGALPGSGGGMKVYTAGASDSAISQIGSGIYDFRTVRFASQGSVVLGHIYTRTNVSTSTVTAISKVGNSGATTCAIAGVGNIESNSDSVGLAPITTTQIDEFEECRIELALDAKGCPTSVTATPATCNVEEVDFLDGKTILGGQCNKPSGFVTDGSTCIWYCPTSTGRCFKVCK